MSVTRVPVRSDADIEDAVAGHSRQAGGALVVLPETFAAAHRDTIVAAAMRHRLPAIGLTEILPRSGGLMSYTPDTVEAHEQAATYIDRILRGEQPADLPVQQPVKFAFILNLKTARELGLTIPPGILAITDEVIE